MSIRHPGCIWRQNGNLNRGKGIQKILSQGLIVISPVLGVGTDLISDDS